MKTPWGHTSAVRMPVASKATLARPKLSAYEVMQAGCGVVTDAPQDLATSKRHLAYHGRD